VEGGRPARRGEVDTLLAVGAEADRIPREAPESRGLRALTDRLRAHLDQVHRDVARQHQALRAHARTATGRDPGPDPRWAELQRLHTTGQRLHRQDERLREARDRGAVDAPAFDRFLARLAAHRAALRRFRGGRDVPPASRRVPWPAVGGAPLPARPAPPGRRELEGARAELDRLHRGIAAPRERLARLRAEHDRRQERLRLQRGEAETAAGVEDDPRRTELDRLWAEGEALHVEDEHLRALRALGDVDPGAHARLLERLRAHRAALRRSLEERAP
jgi:hypothetical protein